MLACGKQCRLLPVVLVERDSVAVVLNLFWSITLVASGYDLVLVYSLGVFTNLLTILFLVLGRMSAARLKL